MKLLTTHFMKIILPGLLLMAFAATASAQNARIEMRQLDRFDDLADKVITVDVGESLINLALSAINPKRSQNEAVLKDILSGLKGVYVKRFEFDKEDAYTKSDVDY